MATEVKVARRILLDVDFTVLVTTAGVTYFDSCRIWRQQVDFLVLDRVAVHAATTGLFVFNYFKFGKVALGLEVTFFANDFFLRTHLIAKDEWVTLVAFLFRHRLQIPL